MVILQHVLVRLGHIDYAEVFVEAVAQRLLHELQLGVGVGLGRNQVSQRLVEAVLEALVRESARDVGSFADDFEEEGFALVELHPGELVRRRPRYFQKRVAGHLHNPGVLLPHELEKLPDHRLQEGPVVAQEGGVLAYHVHDAGGDHRLVLLPLLMLAELQQRAQGADEERPLFAFLDAAAERPHDPREGVKGVVVEVLGLLLLLDLLQDKLLHLWPVVPHQVLAQLALYLIQGSVFCVLHFLAHWHPLLIDHDQHFLRLCHLQTHYSHYFPEDLLVGLLQSCALHSERHCPELAFSPHTLAHALSLTLVQVGSDVEMEEIDGNFEHLVLIDFHHH